MAEKVESTDKIDVGEWKTISTSKSFPGIPTLGSNTYSCPCSSCKAILKETAHWTSNKKGEFSSIFKIGDRVLVYGALPGVVHYVGDLDSDYTNAQVLVGVKLDDPVGEHDGMFHNKRFFKCPDKHGVIVPLEAVHLLVPSDGHTVTVNNNSGVASDFCSMPQLMEAVKSEIQGTSTKATKSNSVVSAAGCNSPVSMKLVSSTTHETKKKSSDYVSKPSGSILKVTTKASKPTTSSGVTDSIGNTASKVTIKKEPDSVITTGLWSLSCSAAASAKSNLSQGSSVKIVESKSVPGSTKPNTGGSVSTKSLKSDKSAKNHHSAGSLKTKEGLKSSMKSLIGSLSNQKAKSSNSIRSASAKSLEKVAVSRSAASSATSKENSKNTGESPGTHVPKGDSNSKATQKSQTAPPGSPLPKSASEGKLFKLSPRPSYTKCLLSGLPVAWMITPATADDQLSDVQEFAEWVENWGGGLRGWAMAQTLQKLKTAHHKGKKEILWQKTIDELEKDEHYASRIQRIKALREQISKVRSRRCELDKQIRSTVFSRNETKLTVTQIEEDVEVQKKEQEELMEKLLGHSLAGKVKGLRKFLGLED